MSFCTKSKRKSIHGKSKSIDDAFSLSDLPSLRRKRTIIFNRVAKALEVGSSASLDLSNRELFIAHYDDIKANAHKFEELHFLIIDLSDRSDEDQNIQETFDEMYFKIKSIYRSLTKEEIKFSNSSNRVNERSNIKLPKISIPTFSGDLKQWPEFIDKYNSLIHNCPSLTDTDRFHYLVSSLRDDASSVIRRFPVNSQHYQHAYDCLVSRYQNERELAFTCWRDILNINLKVNNAHEFRRTLDSIEENLCILKRLNLPVDQWEFILNYHVLSKLDSKIRCEYEQQQPSGVISNYNELTIFLKQKCDALIRDTHFTDSIKPTSTTSKENNKSNYTHFTPKRSYSSHTLLASNSDHKDSTTNVTGIGYKCSYCGEPHSIKHCKDFLLKTVDERRDIASSKQWCYNCLKASHQIKNCNSIFACQKCNRKHHTLLHNDANKSTQSNSSLLTNSDKAFSASNTTVLLATALIQLMNSDGRFLNFRALFDTGSQNNFITERASQLLNIKTLPTSTCVSGLGGVAAKIKGHINCILGTGDQPLIKLNLQTIHSICGDQPIAKLNRASATQLNDIKLADPGFDIPGPIDVLLGADVFAECVLPERIKGTSSQPPAFNSVFGWLLLGRAPLATNSLLTVQSGADGDLSNLVQRFWEIDSPPQSVTLSPDDQLCEKKFKAEHSRDASGRYMVKLPFKTDGEPVFFGIRDIALRRFHALERRLGRDPELHRQYSDFIADYLAKGHMTLVPMEDIGKGKYYIPHHCVIRPESHTTKLRVVFDASAQDSNHISLNDTLLKGAKLQANINEILLRFRESSIVFMADIQQMFRQILVDPCHRDYQRILWRFNENSPIQEYRLNTVTYGTASAPFQACRVIQQLVHDEGSAYPIAREILSSGVGIYVDDIVSGRNTLADALLAKLEIVNLLKLGKFHLRKWASNNPLVLADIPQEDRLLAPISLDEATTSTLKVLGLKWDPASDCFLFDVTTSDRPCTKRTILSEIAKVFDPLGFLSPLTVKIKCLIQQLWIAGVGWDDRPPSNIVELWNNYQLELHLIKGLKIPRRLTVDNATSYEVHGFCDSSELAYGASLYMKITNKHDEVHIVPITSKARVAPIKQLSLPRLELCAAVLLANLYDFFQNTYKTSTAQSLNVYFWCDSTIVLSWLHSHSSRWATFVANRVSLIQDKTPVEWWHHISSSDNAADVCSRGQLPKDLMQNGLWWAGPSWLSLKTYPKVDSEMGHTDPLALSEIKRSTPIALLLQNSPQSLQNDDTFLDTLLNKFSSIEKIIRIISYCNRFIKGARRQTQGTNNYITSKERQESLLIIVKFVQFKSFQNNIMKLNSGQTLPKPFRKLNPFVDDRGVLRVGGRIRHAGLGYEQRHPALLPPDSLLTVKLIESIHRTHCHAGMNTTHYLLLQQFWIISAKRKIRHCLSKCIRCYRVQPQPLQPYMSDLPKCRVNQVKAFSIVGVDYGGPFRIKLGAHRGAKIDKAYLCLFVCLTTKAVHLEVVSSLSTEGFIAALRRFVARRGRCNTIHADCGTNFVGARNLFSSLMENAAGSHQIEFKFNAPSAPHFGGVWEIQIKAAKTHLYRIVGDQVLTFEELTTLFCQIEAVLNSRPLCPLSSDPNDMNVLTPGHFLTLEPLTTVPDNDLLDININRLNRWQLIQSFQQNFWLRWKNEYLHGLIQRAKWTKMSKPLQIDTMVLIKDDNRTPLHWSLGRVVELHPGADNQVRVATVKTANNNLIKRPLVKLCPLPISP